MEGINDLMTVSEAARILGVSEQTVRSYETRRLLPASRLSTGTRIFSRSDVERLAATQKQAQELRA